MLARAAWYWDKRGVRGDRKESELGLASALPAQLELKGRVVTGDALYAQRELSLRVLERGGDYFWMLKDNQPGVKEAVSLLFEQPPWGESFAYACREGQRGDRWESRRLWASAALNGYLDWPGLGQVCCVERTRRRKGRETVERAYAITSLTPERADAARLPPGCWIYGGGTGGLRTGCTGCGTWSLARTKAKCGQGRRRNCWRRCGIW